jgi:NitT/TauT family transport system substrate-binding protein
MIRSSIAIVACAWSLTVTAADGVRLCLNWAPGADHAPIYFAREQGWFADANVAVEVVPGGGSGDALKKLAEGDCEAAIADFGAVRAARTAGRDVIAVMTIFADSPLAFYSLEATALARPGDLAGKRIAAYPTDPPRRLWPAFAARHGLAENTVTWIDLPNNAKVAALARGEIQVAANGFYHHHVEYVEAFGDRLRVLWWRDVGPNPIGNVLALSRSWVATHRDAARAFVRSIQRGYAACVRDADPCVGALIAANPHLILGREQAKWAAALPLIAPPRRAGMTLGAFDPAQPGVNCTDPARGEIGDLPCTDLLLDLAVTTPR